MKTRHGSQLWFFSLIALVAIGLAAVEYVQRAEAANGDSVSVTYSQGAMRVLIPYDLDRSGNGRLSIEVLDPEDQVLGRLERPANVKTGKGSWLEELNLQASVPPDELVWDRLHYRFVYDDGKRVGLEDTESISEVLRRPVVHIIGAQSYLSGAEAAVRVVVTDERNQPVGGASSLRVQLAAPGQSNRVLFTGPLNPHGTAQAQFRLPAGLKGNYSLRYTVDTPIGSTEFTQAVRLEDKVAILLSTEKPLYQPGQIMHVRALALDRSNHEAAASDPLTFEVEDSKGNKVFKKVTQTDKFGVASAEFALADEVNLGTYRVRALLGGQGADTAEMAIDVERYVLPKFKVAVDFGGKENPAKHGYRPGDHVTGTIRANYFFGKPVDGAPVTVKASAMDVAVFEASSAEGKTDAQGDYKFDLKLPDYFAGKALTQGAAQVLIEATVKDGAGHAETRGEPITVSKFPLIVTAVPEGGTLIPNLDNQVFLLASYADGKPAVVDMRVDVAGGPSQRVTTDAGGVAVIHVMGSAAMRSLDLDATDKEGNRFSLPVPLEVRPGSEQILLRTEKAVYKAGDRIQLDVFSTRKQGTAYVDVIKEGQTVLTRDLDIVNGRAQLALTATPDLAGTLDINAYLFGGDARPIGDHRLAFVEPADELKIEATADAASYQPGDDARIRFRVTNSKGEGVQAALGVQVVDEAVFALAEKQPGFAKVFFYLEQEAMKPRYEIHSLGMPEAVARPDGPQPNQQDRAARALFAATEIVNRNRFETELGRTVPQTKLAAYTQRYRAHFDVQATEVAQSLSQLLAKQSGSLTDAMAKLNPAEARDAWGTALRVEPTPWDSQKRTYYLRSAGLNKKFGDADDLVTFLSVRSGSVVDNGGPNRGSIRLNLEHNRGPFNAKAEIAGTVEDQAGAVVPGATVQAKASATGAVYQARTDRAGGFALSALPPGDYSVAISMTGFRPQVVKFSLAERDRAVAAAVLSLGATTETVTVASNVPLLKTETGLVMPMAAPMMMQQAGGGGGGGGRGGRGGGALAINGFARESLVINKKDGPAADSLRQKDIGSPEPRVRSYFPEALYINPEIITDASGRASIEIPMADSITTWRMAMLASTARGALGSGTSSLKVFQDFFVDLDLPVTLTQGDRVSIPVAAYNYSGSRGDVSLTLKQDDWFALVADVPNKNLTVDSGQVGGSQFTLQANRIGKFKLTLTARMTGASKGADIVVREIEVIPNGKEQTEVFNGRLETSIEHEVKFPAGAISDASKILVRLYPGPLSQVIEGMDAILRMPGGCFEQTSSSTYPNVLALDYMKRTKKLTPEVHAKAEGFIANGYQRLLTFEVPGGGFSWFGQAPANKILTGYGLMEFSDMSKVHDVDPSLIHRTQQWLASQQQADGSWKPDTNFINEGATNRYNSDVLRITAYIGWSLENTGYQGPAVEKARQYVEQNIAAGKKDSYTLAVLANFAADYGKNPDFTRQAMQNLMDAAHTDGDQVSWSAEETAVYSTGASASVETTALAAQALLKWDGGSGMASKALKFIAAKKDANGTWGTTQATIMALRALLLSAGKSSADVSGSLEITLNSHPVQQLTLAPDNNDLLHQFVLKGIDAKGDNHVGLRFQGKGGLAYQVVGSYYVPWDQQPEREALSIGVAFDRTQLAQDDIATATATVKNNLRQTANMVMVDLGIPPGFDLLSEDLQSYVEKSANQKSGRLEKFSLTATQAILYFDAIGAGDTVKLQFRLRAKYPIRAKTFASRAYEYYDPAVNAVARPVQLEIRRK